MQVWKKAERYVWEVGSTDRDVNILTLESVFTHVNNYRIIGHFGVGIQS